MAAGAGIERHRREDLCAVGAERVGLGEGVSPLFTRARVWGGGVPPPQIIFWTFFYLEIALFGAF